MELINWRRLGFSEIHNAPLLAPLSFTGTCFIPIFFTKLAKVDYRDEVQRWITLSFSLFILYGLTSPFFPPSHS